MTIEQTITRLNVPRRSRFASFAYIRILNRTMMADSTGRTTYTFDELSRMTQLIRPSGKRLTYSWDALGQRRRMHIVDNGRYTAVYDAAGRISYVRTPANDRTTFSYDAASRRTVKRLANGSRASFSYDAADRITRVANIKSTGVTISSYDYRYDNSGNRTSVLEADASRVTWSYDNTYQLLGENRTGTSPYRNTFTYDSRGNRTLKNESGARTTYAYDAANQLVYSAALAGRTTYTFDANGNQRVVLVPAGTRTTTTWDYENQPTVYRYPTGPRTTMLYNADNQRVQKKTGTATTNFIWDFQNIFAEATSIDAVVTPFTYEPGQFGNLIGATHNFVKYIYHYDALGSTRQLTDPSQNVTDTWLYDAWGNTVARTGTTGAFFQWIGEVGYYYDTETGLFSIRRRPYGPTIARWTSRDPLLFSGGSNLYLYVLNRPVSNVDPSGLDVLHQKAVDGYPARYWIARGESSIWELVDEAYPGEWGQLASATSGSHGCCATSTVISGPARTLGALGWRDKMVFGTSARLREPTVVTRKRRRTDAGRHGRDSGD